MNYELSYKEKHNLNESDLTDAQRTLHYIAENMRMEKSISEDGYKDFQQAIEALEQQPCEDDISKFISRRVSLLEERMSSATSEGRWVEEEKYQCAIENLELVDEYIKVHPPVTPKEKTKCWVGIDEEPHEDWECDNCGFVVWADENIEKFHYCPNCGRRMVESQESEEQRWQI